MVEVPVKANAMEQVVPFWTGFNKILSDRQPDHVVVAYPPIIDVKPADMATVYTTMCKCMDIPTAVGQDAQFRQFTNTLYANAQQVKWYMPDKLESHVLRLGGFHALSCFMSALGKIWATVGLRDLLVDSGVYAGCTLDQILQGKQFNRGVRAYALVYEALTALYFHAFFQCCSNEDGVANVDERFWEELADTHAAFYNHNTVVDLSKLSILFREQLSPLFTAFSEFCCRSSPTFRIWEMFLRAVEIILMNVRVERDGNLLSDLQSVSSMLPYFFVEIKHTMLGGHQFT
jgi:hypothetical protein